MNPNDAIRKWLVASGTQFGIKYAYDYKLPDSDTRAQVPYFTYQIVNAEKVGDGILNESTKSGTTVYYHFVESWITNVRIDLYNSQDGFDELRSVWLGAHSVPEIRKIFADGDCEPKSILEINNVSQENIDDYEAAHNLFYHQYMICSFVEDIEFRLTITNGTIDQVDLTLYSDGATYEIDRSGITQT